MRLARAARRLPVACAASFIGTLPFALLNYWLVKNWPTYVSPAVADRLYLLRMLALILWEAPLATAAATRYLGQSMFFTNPTARRIASDVKRSLPQLILYQVLLRGLWILPAVLFDWSIILVFLWLIPLLVYPYLNEVILLEQNPISARSGRITTWRAARCCMADRAGACSFAG